MGEIRLTGLVFMRIYGDIATDIERARAISLLLMIAILPSFCV